MYILITCNEPSLGPILQVIRNIITVIQILVPIILIVMSTINLIKMMSNPDDKKMVKKILNSVLAAILVFIVPVFIDATMNLLGENFTISSCWSSMIEPDNTVPKYIDPYSNNRNPVVVPGSKYQTGDEREEDSSASANNDTSSNISNIGVSSSDFNRELSSMSTPSKSQLKAAARANNIDDDYLIVIIGTTQREGYFNDPYLFYGWASSMINNRVNVQTLQSWDPYNSGESNYYSMTNIRNGYNTASPTVKKAVYLALTKKNTKIIECNGMYSSTPSNYNLLYKSSVYNCSIYENK